MKEVFKAQIQYGKFSAKRKPKTTPTNKLLSTEPAHQTRHQVIKLAYEIIL